MDHLRPRISLPGEGLRSLFSTSSPGPLLIRAPLTLEDEDNDSDSEPDLPRIKLSYGSGASRSVEPGETASERAFAADPVEATDVTSAWSPKGWTLRPLVASPGGIDGDQEDVLLDFRKGSGRLGPMPIARVSMEFDDDEEEMGVTEETEEDEFVARVPGFALGDEEGPAEGNESQPKVKSQGHDWKWSEVLEANSGEDLSVKDATESSASDGEKSESNGATDGIGRGKSLSAFEIKPCSDDQNQSELLEVSTDEDFSVKDIMIESKFSGDDIRSDGVMYGTSEDDDIMSLDMKSCSEDRWGFPGEKDAEILTPRDAAASSLKEVSVDESVMVMEVGSSGWRLGFVSEVTLQDLEAKGSPSMEKVEVGIDCFNIVDSLVSNCRSEPGQTTERESEQSLFPGLDTEIKIVNDVKLVNVLEDASESRVPPLAADTEKIVVCYGCSDQYEYEGDGEGKQLFSLEPEGNLIITGERSKLSRLKFLRLLNILGCLPQNPVGAQVLGEESTNPLLRFGVTKKMGTQHKSEGSESLGLDFSLNIVVLGKLGVGKSSTIDSILDGQRVPIDPLRPATTSIKETLGTVCGIRVRILDTPGLRVSVSEQAFNQKMLSAVKTYINAYPPDTVLYVDRLDDAAFEFNDLPVLQMITHLLGPSIWEKAIAILTHAASFPFHDGPYNAPFSYEAFVGQRLDLIRSCIEHLSRLNHIPPVSLVKNNCRKEVLRDEDGWRIQLLLLCCSMKIMAEESPRSQPLDSICPWGLLGICQSDQGKNTDGAKHGCTEIDGTNLNILVDSSIYAMHGEPNFNLVELKIWHLGGKTASNLKGQARLLGSMRMSADEDEGADVRPQNHDRSTLENCLVPCRGNLSTDFPVDKTECPQSFSLTEVGGDCALRANLQSQFSLGLGCSKLDALVGLRDKRRWKITLRTSSSHCLPISIVTLLPIAGYIFRLLFPGHGSRAPSA